MNAHARPGPISALAFRDGASSGHAEGHEHGPHGHDSGAFCPIYHRAIELIGRRWTGAILRALLGGHTRFSDIAAVVPGLSDRLLSERLKELEAEGIVTRTVIPSTPVRVEYGLTAKGEALDEVIAAVSAWAAAWAGEGHDGEADLAACEGHEASRQRRPALKGPAMG